MNVNVSNVSRPTTTSTTTTTIATNNKYTYINASIPKTTIPTE